MAFNVIMLMHLNNLKESMNTYLEYCKDLMACKCDSANHLCLTCLKHPWKILFPIIDSNNKKPCKTL